MLRPALSRDFLTTAIDEHSHDNLPDDPLALKMDVEIDSHHF